jgi:hypothetical protein
MRHNDFLRLFFYLTPMRRRIDSCAHNYIGTDRVRAVRPEVLDAIVQSIPVRRLHVGATQRDFDMHRTYSYRHFTIEVKTESVDGICRGKVLLEPGGYVAVVDILMGTIPAVVPTLRLGRDNGSSFATEAETLMRGYGTAQRIIDDMLTANTPARVG